jgi:mannose-6-phosphate isomerase
LLSRMSQSSMDLYPYILEPKETTAIWGSESWKCWDENRVRNGSLAGKRVSELREMLGARLLGGIDSHRLFPVLTKVITANDWLSVQVHPGDAYAQRVEHEENGKTESWYIFSAQSGAELVLGWNTQMSRGEYERRVADGTLGDVLRRVQVKAGDAFYLPAGMLHAIGAGIVLFETQQASDLTYRIFDWNRVGTDGKSRPLHVEKAADVLDYHAGTGGALEAIDYAFESLQHTVLIADRNFLVERVLASNEPASIATHDRPLILMPIDRNLSVNCNGDEIMLEPRECALIPAAVKYCSLCSGTPRESVSFMFVTPPPDTRFLQRRLLAAGIDPARIDRFVEQF